MTRRHTLFTMLAILAAILCFLTAASAEMSTNLQVEVKRGMRNLPLTETYVDGEGNPVIATDKGYATIRYTYGVGRVVTRIELLDAEGKPVNGAEGYARIENRYSGKQLTERRYYDKDGNPVNGPQGYARQETKGLWGDRQSTWEYDKDGNPVNLHRIIEYTQYGQYRLIATDSWYDTEDRLAMGPDGYARVENEYISTLKSKSVYLDEKGQPCYNAKAGYAMLTREFNKAAEISLNYYGADGERIAGPDGYSYALYSYRYNGYKKSMFYNADGTLWYNNKGICGIEILQNVRKQIVEEYYFTGEGERGRNTDGYSGVIRAYNKYRKQTLERYVDENNKPLVVEKLGYAKKLLVITDKKRLSREEYYDDHNRLTTGPKGYSVMAQSFEHGQVTEVRYLDTDGKSLINTVDGYARITYERDKDKHVIRTNWYDAEGNPCPGDSGAEEVRNTWNDKNKESESYWTAAGNPAEGPDGVNEIRMEYNGAGKVTKKTLYDATGRVVPGKDGYAVTETEYNSEGGKMCVRYYDAEGGLVLTPGKEYAYERTVLLKDLSLTGLEEEDADGDGVVLDGGEGEEETDEDENEDEDEGEEEPEEDFEITEKTEEATADEDAGESGTQEYAPGVKGSVTEYFGTDGKPMTLKAGYASVERKNNSAGKVTEESYFNADHEPVTLAAGYAKVEREYDRYGALSREAYFDREGGKATLAAGYHCYTRVNDNRGNALQTAYFSADGKPVVNSSIGCHRVDKTYQDAKHVLSESWYDTEGRSCAAKDTYARIERTFDRNGNTISEKTFDTAGKPICRNAGYDEIQQMFNDKDQVIQILYRKDARLCEDVNGVAVIQRSYDEEGNVAEEWYLDITGMATTSLKTGYHRIVREYLDAKHVTSEKYYDPWGKPTTAGDTYVQIRREFDSQGNTVRECTYGPFRRPIARNAGYDEARWTYDGKNRITRIEYMLDGKHVLNRNGAAIIEREYDEKDCVASESYYGTEGEPVLLGGNKYHRIARTWLDAKHATSETWFDIDGEPMTQGDTYVRIERAFDERGNTVSETTCGADGNPIARNAGYDQVRNTFDEGNRAVRIEYLLGGAPVARNDGVSIIEREYDEKDCVAAESYYGTEGEPVLPGGSKYHRIERTWLDAKHATSEAWFDTEGQPMTQGDTYVRIERAFDERGNMLSETTCGADGNPVARNAGYDQVRNTYNEKNQAVRTEYLLGGALTLRKDGVAVILREYDDQGFVAAESYYGTAGEPVLLSGKKYHRIERTWLDAKHATSEAWFDTNGQPMTQGDTYVRIRREFDERGNTVSEVTCDADGRPIACKDGYDETRWTYNEKDQGVRTEYLLGGAPVLKKDGVAVILREYDDEGNVAAESYYGTAGEPVLLNGKKYHRIERTWLDTKHATSEAWFGIDGQPMTQGDTYVRIERTFDGNGNKISEITCDEAGKPIARKDGYDETRWTYNKQDQAVKTAYLLDGAAVLNKDKVSSIEREYDDQGFVAAESYYGTTGEPVLLNGKKYHRIERTWADAKHATSEAWFGVDGEAITQGDTYVKIEREYDEKGNCTEERYYGPDGGQIPLQGRVGHAQVSVQRG